MLLFIYLSVNNVYINIFQEQRTSQLPLELDQITDDSASTRPDANVKSKYYKITLNAYDIGRDVLMVSFIF